MELFLSQGLLSLRSLESVFYVISAIAELFFFFLAIAAITEIPIQHLQTIFLWIKNACDPSQSWVLRKWNSNHDKCVDPSWFSKATTTTMINRCKSAKRLPGCYAEFITFAILLRKRFNQGLFIRILKKEKKKTVDSLGGCHTVNS